MKKYIFISLTLLLSTSFVYSQKFNVTSNNNSSFKRHFSYSIEGGLVDNLPRQFVAGNRTDWMSISQNVVGNSFSGNTIHNGTEGILNNPIDNIILTDFVIEPGNYQYASGTGIYFPNGPTGMGYPFIG